MALGRVRHHVGVVGSKVRSGLHVAARTLHGAARVAEGAVHAASKVDRVISTVKPVYERTLHPALKAGGYGNIADAVGKGLSTYESIRRSIR